MSNQSDRAKATVPERHPSQPQRPSDFEAVQIRIYINLTRIINETTRVCGRRHSTREMSRGKKRKHGTDSASDNQISAPSQNYTPVKKDLLLLHYPLVRTLRQHMLASLPDTSKVRRKKIAALGSSIGASEIEAQLAHVLDTALVGCGQPTPRPGSEENTWQQWLSFSHKGDESYVTISNGIDSSIDQQSEVCFCLPNCSW